ncbi:MAG TPA: MFS transporter [Patescibacteria group bacterium]|nr:MFS transporter [Patescibacteria group bacterium]
MTTTPAERLFTPAFVTLTLSELAYFTAAGLIIGLTPFYVTGPLGSDEAGLGMAAAAFSITTLLLRPYAGRLSDRRGRRPLLVAGALVVAVVILAHAVTTSLMVLIGLRLLLGVGEAFFFVAGYAALADLAPRGRTGEALSYNSLALYLGIALGPIIGQVLLRAGGFDLAWAGGFALAMIAVLLALRLPETAARLDPDAPAAPLFHRAAIGPGLALFAGVAAMSAFMLLAGPRAERIGLDGWSLTFLLFGGVVVACRVLFARLPDRLPPMRLGAMALALSAVGLMIAASLPGVAALLAGSAVLAVGVAFMTPALFAATFNAVAPSERGAAAGTATLFIDLGFGGGPLLAGFVAAGAGIPAAFAVAAGIALVGAVGTLVVPRLASPPLQAARG